ncbi:Leucine zipper-EF-hand-containing transmembrane protein 1 mitochondrial [Paragonimus heterotremus]|uniref:Mitochondrial proton/calcium exchanger protein n=1 Tax=Paragonimus heterotremus TaxID=100268 RepID=A0A8J4WF13_9TREM|nr:Leucine zipper-EF-hand-containing transmembrane protein 1 mitochondrial [Paragonimus heterotremus]
MLCQLLSLPTIGPSNLLRFQIWMRVRQLKAEDRLIAKEGVEQIPAWELQSLCQDRGMRSAGMTEEKLRFQLCQWLTLHLEKNVPVTLLLFSRAMHVTHALADELPLKEAIAQLPPSVSEEATARVLETTPHTELDPRTKMEVLRKEQASIKAARVQRKQELAKQKSTSESEAKLVPDVLANNEVMVDTAPTLKGLPKEDLLPLESGSDALRGVSSEKPSITVLSDTITERTVVPSSSPTTSPETHVGAEGLQSVVTEPIVKKAAANEEDTEISVEDLTQIETAIAESSNALNEEALHGLKEEVAETEKIQQKHEATLVSSEHVVDKRTSKAAALLAARVNRMIGEMDTMIIKVDEERKRLLRDIKAREANVMQLTEDGKQTELLDAIKADQQRVIDIGDLLAALKRLQKVPDDARWVKILEVLDEDHDGKIELQHILSAIELLGSEKITLNSKEVKRVLEMFDNELLAERIESNHPANDSTTLNEPASENSQEENKSSDETSYTSFPSPKPSVHSSVEAKMNPPTSKS